MVQEYMDKVIFLASTVIASLGGTVIGIVALIRWVVGVVRKLKTGKEEYDTKAASLESVCNFLIMSVVHNDIRSSLYRYLILCRTVLNTKCSFGLRDIVVCGK